MPAGAVVVIDGEPGVGKTTLIDVACSRAEAAGAVVVRVSADEFSAARPLGLLPAEVQAAGGADTDAMLEHLERVAAGRPCMVAFDDLQWADPASLALLGPLVRRAVPAGVVLVLAHRSWPRAAALDELLDRVAPLEPVVLTLRPMSVAEVRVLGELQVGKPLGVGVCDLLDRAGGNPFYALSLMRMLDAEGSLDETGAFAELVGPTPAVERSTLAALVVRRVALLGHDAELVLQHAAVLGRSFTASGVASLAATTPEAVAAALLLSVKAEVLVDEGTTLAFRHDLLREALVQSLPASWRMTLHRNAAVLCDSAGDRAAAAAHLLRAELRLEDVPWLTSMIDACAPPVGLALLDRALSLMAADDARYQELAAERADFLLWNGKAQEAVDAARELLAAGVDAAAAVHLRATVAHALFLLGRPSEAVDTWEPFTQEVSARVRAEELAELAFANMFAGRLHQSRLAAEEACSLSDDATNTTVASLVLAYVSAAAGDVVAAQAHADRAVDAAPAAAESAKRFGPTLIRASVRDFCGDPVGALEDVMADDRDPADRASVVRVPFRLSVAATVHFRAARWDDALANADAGALASRDLSVAAIDGWLSALPMVITLFRHGPGAAASVGLPVGQAYLGSDWLLWAQALVREAEGDPAGALDLLQLVATVGSAMGSGAAALLVTPDAVRIAHQLGRPEAAEAVLATSAWAGSVRDVPAAAEYAWALALHRRDAAGVLAAADALAAVRPFQGTRALRDAALLLAATDPVEARVVATRAIAGFDVVGADDAAARLRAGLRSAGVRLRAGKPAAERVGWGSITATERMVVELVAAGCTNSEIADRLYTSRRTVESHLVHVYNKVGVRSRVDLAREAAKQWPN
jgi:DNA-binding CsgD family transcriptional regulator/tetratricopeptide (TPR) repeat protein